MRFYISRRCASGDRSSVESVGASGGGEQAALEELKEVTESIGIIVGALALDCNCLIWRSRHCRHNKIQSCHNEEFGAATSCLTQ
jgi:hypothetical protein